MKVRLTRGAQAELTTILSYVHERNPSGAVNLLAAIEHSLELMARQPRASQATDYPSVRMKLVARFPYKIFYRIEAGYIDVVHIRHAARRSWEGP